MLDSRAEVMFGNITLFAKNVKGARLHKEIDSPLPHL